jgi:dTDP-4-amino-4,6-dideoxygalactose transaminase
MAKKRHINITQALLPEFDDYVDQLKGIWETHWMTHNGDQHHQLEEALKSVLNVKELNLFVNGHLSLEAALEALALKGEIITTPFTFPSTAHAIIRQGCIPVFCDIKQDDYTIDESKIEALITNKTVAILPVHLFGYPCDIDAIKLIADKHQLKVIYDAAHAFGVSINGTNIANFGDISMFSMNATKVFNTIEGGLLTYQDPALKEKLDLITYYGIKEKDRVIYPGSNLKMNEFQAAMGLCNLPLVNDEIAKRKKIADRYLNGLKTSDKFQLPIYHDHIVYNYAYFPILVKDALITRDIMFDRLQAQGIYPKKYFTPLVPDYECYQDLGPISPLPIARKIAKEILVLPLYGELSLEDTDLIISLLNQ